MGKILRAVTNDGTAKISVITAPDMVERAREIHHLHPVGTAALGRTLCGASLLGEMLKEDNAALTLRIQGGGPIGTILAVSDNAGNVRGYVSHPEVDLPIRERDGKLSALGIAVSVVVMLAAVYLGNRMDIAIAASRELDLSFGQAFAWMHELVDADAYRSNLITLYLFSAIGAVPAAFNAHKIAKEKGRVYRIGE